MTGWDIDPAGVRAVVTRTQSAGDGFATAAATYQTGARQAAANCDSPIVVQALAGFATHHEHTLPALMSRTYRALTGAVKATNAYLTGDLEMAERAQRHAARTPTPSLEQQ